MRLFRAELLKARRRQATYVVLIVGLVLMALSYLATGSAFQFAGIIEFPAAYAVIGQFTFGLGGLLAVIYTAAFIGADWTWGVLRNVVARGESRAGYLLAKAAALAILLGIGMLIMVGFGLVMTYITGFLYNVPIASPLRGRGIVDLVEWLALGYPVLLQRAAIGFAVAVVLRSQLAGAVVGVVLFVGEAIVTSILTVVAFTSRLRGDFDPDGELFQRIGPEWFQFLPISIGGSVLSGAPGGSGPGAGGGIEQFLLEPVPLWIALAFVILYGVVAMVISVLALNRQEIV